MKEYVILVDENDNQIGLEEKITAHEKGLLHRAFSVIIFRKKDGLVETLLQQRNLDKYHSGGLWTNACCSHPRDGEDIVSAGKRRLKEELGISLELSKMGSFIYKHKFENGLTEYELDHVLCGTYDKELLKEDLNKDEVHDIKWVKIKYLKDKMEDMPGLYTAWFKNALDIALDKFDLEKI